MILTIKKVNQDKQLKYDKAYLKMAAEWAKLSYCERKQVGVIVKNQRLAQWMQWNTFRI